MSDSSEIEHLKRGPHFHTIEFRAALRNPSHHVFWKLDIGFIRVVVAGYHGLLWDFSPYISGKTTDIVHDNNGNGVATQPIYLISGPRGLNIGSFETQI